MSSYVLGISSYYHDSSACLFKDGKLVFACEEEKFTGIKHDKSFPNKTIKYIFRKFKLTYKDISCVCYYEDPTLKTKRVLKQVKENFVRHPFTSLSILSKNINNRVELSTELTKFTLSDTYFSNHHDSHLYYSQYTSNFNKSMCLSIDGVGEMDSTTVSFFDDRLGKKITISEYPNSIGLFYSAMTSYLGFKPNEGEYKVMGLSAYGSYKKYIQPLREFIYFKDGKIICDMKFFNWDRSTKLMFTKKMVKNLQLLPRLENDKILQSHKDLSSAVQKRYEELLFEIINYYSEDHTNLCLGGGCAYNGLANGKIYKETPIKHLWIPLSPSDSGSSIGACIKYFVEELGIIPKIPKTPFLGPSFKISDENLKRFNSFKVSDDNLYRIIAKEIRKGKVIGWYRDEIEFGARALGNRSILADPTNPNMKERINRLVKKREGFRPFAPMVTKERQKDFFEVVDDVPYMNQVVKVKKEHQDKLVSVTHIDGTARIQTVYNDNPIFNLLREFEKLTSYPILLNTSFNVKDKTMVLTPNDAINTFKNTDIDILVLQNTIIFNKRNL